MAVDAFEDVVGCSGKALGASRMPERTSAERTAKAQKLRHRGEECRTLACLMTTKEIAASYLSLADVYDVLAEQESRLRVMSSS